LQEINIFLPIVELVGLLQQPQLYLTESKSKETPNGQISIWLLRFFYLVRKKLMDVMEVITFLLLNGSIKTISQMKHVLFTKPEDMIMVWGVLVWLSVRIALQERRDVGLSKGLIFTVWRSMVL
jgi:hypothetical protein